ncbi:MAG: hypothetical protein ACK58L_15480, partial [Planctomycetota bacterium]
GRVESVAEMVESFEVRRCPAASAIAAFHRSGQTFITWTENSAVTGEQYHIYRSHSPITTANISSAVKLTAKWGALDDQTSVNVRAATAAGTPGHFVINDLATPLADNKGLFVYTTPEGGAGTCYYAVTEIINGTETTTLTSGGNSLSTGVVETVAVPKPVLTYRNTSGKGMIYTQYMDYARWNPTFQGYAYNYAVSLPDAYSTSVQWPIKLMPHAYGERMRFEPSAEFGWDCIEVFPDDPGGGAPGERWYTWWYGFAADHNYKTGGSVPTSGVIENFTEQRILKTLDEVASNFSVDMTRTHSQGHSMGASGSVSLGMRYPNIFAGIFASEPMTNYAASPGFQNDFSALWGAKTANLPIVNKGKYATTLQQYNGMGVYNWMNHQEQLVNRRGDKMAFMMVGHGKADDIIDWETQGRPFIAALSAGAAGFTAESRVGWDHNWMGFSFALDSMFSPADGGLGNWIYPNNLSFPAIRNATSSGPIDPGSTGTQFYHMKFEWSTSWNNFDRDIVDTAARYEISLRSLVEGDQADVTPQHLQSFQSPPGVTVTWQSYDNSTGDLLQSGTTTGDADGLITVPQLQFRTGAGIRLILNASNQTPGLTGPVSATTDMTPEMTWTAASDAASYDLWIRNLSTGQDPVLQVNVTGTSFSPTTDLGIGKYRVWVRSRFAGGNASVWSGSRDFQINTPPTINAMTSPDYSGLPLITWTALAGATRYEIYINNLSTGETAVIRDAGVTTNSYQILSNRGIANYRVWVRAFDAAGYTTGWSSQVNFTSAARVSLIGPSTPTFATKPLFEWNALPGAVKYEMLVANRKTGATVLSVKNIATTSWMPGTSLAANDYRFWVRGINAAGIVGGWSPQMDFSVGGRPVLLLTSGTFTDRTPTFAWSSVADAATYELWVSRLDTGAAVIRLSGLTSTTHTPATDLIVGKTYRVWVRAVSRTAIISAWSQFVDLRIAESADEVPLESSEQTAILVTSLDVFPVPFAEPVVPPSSERPDSWRSGGFRSALPESVRVQAAGETGYGLAQRDVHLERSFSDSSLIDAVMLEWLETLEPGF